MGIERFAVVGRLSSESGHPHRLGIAHLVEQSVKVTVVGRT
jgi:hypothetical protein